MDETAQPNRRALDGVRVLDLCPTAVDTPMIQNIVFSSIPNCGRCPSCAEGRPNLCDLAAGIMTGRQLADGSSRHRLLAGQEEKQVIGCIFGSVNSRADVPRLLNLCSGGLLDLDGMVTSTYSLEDVNQGYQDMRDGKNIRGVLVM